MANLNKVILVGRLVRDPEKRTTNSNITYVRFVLAVNRTRSRDNVADFIPVVAWRQTADFLIKYIRKGALLLVEGSFVSSNYQNQKNEKITRYEINAENISPLEKRSSTNDNVRTPYEKRDNNKMTYSNNEQKPKNKNEDDDIPWDVEL